MAEQLKDHPPLRAPSPPLKRAVGRPKLKRQAEEMLVAAAATADAQENPSKRGKYTRWFDSPYINDILAAFARTGSARAAVTVLRNSAPDDRYERLSHSTVASWFENGKLKLQYQQELDAGRAIATYNGPSPALLAAPGAEDAICDHLLQLRKAGMPLNSHVIRWVMLAVLDKYPAVLQQLTLSQRKISGRSQLASPHPCGGISCRCSLSSKARLLALFLSVLLLPLLRASTSHAATTIGARRRLCSAGSHEFCCRTRRG